MRDRKIELSAIPSLPRNQAFFGSLNEPYGPVYDDSIVDIMVYLYDAVPPALPEERQG